MKPFIPPGAHTFTAIVSRYDEPTFSRSLTTTAATWDEAHAFFTNLLGEGEYIMDCCDDSVCLRPKSPS